MAHTNAGELRQWLTFQRRAGSAASGGLDALTDNWVDVFSCRGKVTAAGSREFWEAQAAHAELTHRVKIRYRPGVTADMRILYGSRVLEVIAPPIDEDERHQWIILKCREVTT